MVAANFKYLKPLDPPSRPKSQISVKVTVTLLDTRSWLDTQTPPPPKSTETSDPPNKTGLGEKRQVSSKE